VWPEPTRRRVEPPEKEGEPGIASVLVVFWVFVVCFLGFLLECSELSRNLSHDLDGQTFSLSCLIAMNDKVVLVFVVVL